MTNFEEIDYSKVTRQELIDNPHIRPYYLEWMLSYFFGETKLMLNGTIYTIRLLDHKWSDDIFYSTHFNGIEMAEISIEKFYSRFWYLLFNLEAKINASKKSRP